jgi:hypothetical protein
VQRREPGADRAKSGGHALVPIVHYMPASTRNCGPRRPGHRYRRAHPCRWLVALSDRCVVSDRIPRPQMHGQTRAHRHGVSEAAVSVHTPKRGREERRQRNAVSTNNAPAIDSARKGTTCLLTTHEERPPSLCSCGNERAGSPHGGSAHRQTTARDEKPNIARSRRQRRRSMQRAR